MVTEGERERMWGWRSVREGRKGRFSNRIIWDKLSPGVGRLKGH